MRVLPPLEAHRLWAPVYDSTPNPLLALERRSVAPLMPGLAGLRVLDVAAGTGRWARYMKSRGAAVVSVDLCGSMILQAPAPSVIADAACLPFPDQWADLVLCAFAFDYMPPCLDELSRVTRTGGHVVVSDMHPEAAAHGWTRSFRSGDEVIAIQARGGTLADLHHPALRMTNLIEASFGEPERPYFIQAGKPAAFEDARAIPAIYVARWVKR